ncbi:hypothetical protein [Streptomyces paradoxus]|uniref:hypothetical protein n=1 Tax=Streptomyces paradoxus TaxID=66375 RepID=UPI0037CD1317
MNIVERNRMVRDLRIAEMYVREIQLDMQKYVLCGMEDVAREQSRELGYWEGEVSILRKWLAEFGELRCTAHGVECNGDPKQAHTFKWIREA